MMILNTVSFNKEQNYSINIQTNHYLLPNLDMECFLLIPGL